MKYIWFFLLFIWALPVKAQPQLEALVDAAYAEWQAFGAPVLDLSSRLTHRHPGGSVFNLQVPGGNPREIHIYPRLLRLGTKEDDPAIRDRIKAYWQATPRGSHFIARQQAIWQIAPHAGWVDAWSSAFISYLLESAEISPSEVPRSAAHSTYLNYILAAKSQNWQALSLAAGGIPQPGDIICADRATRNTYTSLNDHNPGTFRPLHCDVVVQQDLPNERIMAIGGNVWDAVTLSVLRLHKPQQNWQLMPTDDRPWFVILRRTQDTFIK